MQVLRLQLQLPEQHPQCARQLVVSVFQDPGQCLFDITASLPDGDAALEQQSANLVDHCSATTHPALAHPMQGLQIQLVVRLDRNEAHTWPSHGLGDRFRIDIVVLVRLHVRLHILSRHQAHVVPLLP
jgi:hypothetical protein